MAYWPREPWLDRFVEVHLRTGAHNGGEPAMGGSCPRSSARPASSTGAVTAAVWCYATPEETITWGDSYAERLLTSSMGELPVEAGFATRADIEAMAEAFREWARNPDAFWSFSHVEALGRKPA